MTIDLIPNIFLLRVDLQCINENKKISKIFNKTNRSMGQKKGSQIGFVQTIKRRVIVL